MYSPKINEDLIPILYKLAKSEGKTMTRLVDEILRAKIAKRAARGYPPENPGVTDKVKKRTEDG